MNRLPGYIVVAALILASSMAPWNSAGGRAKNEVPEEGASAVPAPRPNFLLIISDDQSWEHTSFANYPLVKTPNFDRIASEGIYYEYAYSAAPTCTAARSSILSGQPIWRLGSAALLHGYYTDGMVNFQVELGKAGYATGFTGKGWSPGRMHKPALLAHPPAGYQFNKQTRQVPKELGSQDLVANFEQFLNDSPTGSPFSFWVGSIEPHRPFVRADNRFRTPEDLQYLPGFLPNTGLVSKQMSGYLEEIEVFDEDVGRLLQVLEERGLLENTVVVITSDNGMPFSRAKANNYSHGVRVPLAIRWGNIRKPGRVVEDLVSLTDIAPTFLELAGVSVPASVTGKSLNYSFKSDASGIIDDTRIYAYSAFERHAGYIRGGAGSLTYPRRAIHSRDYLYIANLFPERWPGGDPPLYHETYLSLLRDPGTGEPVQPYHSLATSKRAPEEFYDVRRDPAQLHNLAGSETFAAQKAAMRMALDTHLRVTGDPVWTTGRDVFSAYEYLMKKPGKTPGERKTRDSAPEPQL